MRILPLVFGVASVLSPGLASATTVIYDTVNIDPLAFNAGSDQLSPVIVGPNAASFQVPSTQTLTSVSLELSALNPNDGGSLTVALVSNIVVPNKGNQPNNTTVVQDSNLPTTGITTFIGGTVLATILDSSLSTTPSLVTISTSATLTPGTFLWIGLETTQLQSSVLAGDSAVDGTYGSAQWWWTLDNPGGAIGITGQLGFTAGGGPGSFPISGNSPDALGPYEMILTTTAGIPEPVTITIFGSGLAALGYVRRRRVAKT
jgi:hypothetical protein